MLDEVIQRINRGVADILTRAIDLLYIDIVSRFVSRSVLRYFVCGVMNYIVLDALLYYVIYHYVVGVDYYIYIGEVAMSSHVIAMVLVFPLTFISGFWLNRYVAFGVTKPRVRSQMWRYSVSVGGSIVLSYVVLRLLVELWGVWATPAKVLCSIITALYSYLMARFFTFRKEA